MLFLAYTPASEAEPPKPTPKATALRVPWPKPLAEMEPMEVYLFLRKQPPEVRDRYNWANPPVAGREVFLKKREEAAKLIREARAKAEEETKLGAAFWGGTWFVVPKNGPKVPQAVLDALKQELDTDPDWAPHLRRKVFAQYLKDPSLFHRGWTAVVKSVEPPRAAAWRSARRSTGTSARSPRRARTGPPSPSIRSRW